MLREEGAKKSLPETFRPKPGSKLVRTVFISRDFSHVTTVLALSVVYLLFIRDCYLSFVCRLLLLPSSYIKE